MHDASPQSLWVRQICTTPPASTQQKYGRVHVDCAHLTTPGEDAGRTRPASASASALASSASSAACASDAASAPVSPSATRSSAASEPGFDASPVVPSIADAPEGVRFDVSTSSEQPPREGAAPAPSPSVRAPARPASGDQSSTDGRPRIKAVRTWRPLPRRLSTGGSSRGPWSDRPGGDDAPATRPPPT
jgi:hypothetical protein